MVDRSEARRQVNMYRADGDVKLTDENLGATRPGIDQDRRLRRIRADSDGDERSSGDKLDMILSHLDSIHTALADTNARMDALEGKGRADGDDDDEPNDEINYGDPSARGRNVGEDDPAEPTPLVADRAEKDARRGRRDAAYTASEEINKPIERSDALRTAAADWQSRADSVYQMMGGASSAPRYLAGETLLAYKKRILRAMRPYSSSWKDANFMAIQDSQTLDVVADQIFKEAKAHLSSPASVPNGYVREVREKDASGRETVRFIASDGDAIWGAFKSPSRRLVGINIHPDRR